MGKRKKEHKISQKYCCPLEPELDGPVARQEAPILWATTPRHPVCKMCPSVPTARKRPQGTPLTDPLSSVSVFLQYWSAYQYCNSIRVASYKAKYKGQLVNSLRSPTNHPSSCYFLLIELQHGFYPERHQRRDRRPRKGQYSSTTASTSPTAFLIHHLHSL